MSRSMLFTVCLFVILLVLQYQIYVMNAPPMPPPANFKTILYWNPMFGRKDFWWGIGSKIFDKCDYTNCFATYRTDMLSSIEKFDAIVFHAPEYTPFVYGKPWRRSPHQAYIFYGLESPVYWFKNINDNCNGFYNWTISYRRDSDIFSPYGDFVEKPTNYELPSIESIKNKTKHVAWLVSHCNALSKRDEIAQRLQKFIPIDIYGKCGTLSCPVDQQKKCYQMIEKNYKFYLSFENAICEDYVTEKLFHILRQNIVPIVYGGGNYSKIAPPKSVINVMDFDSVEDLGKYLKFLDENPEEYLKFFEWKKYYAIQISRQPTVCEVCKKLNEPLKSKVYNNIVHWWASPKLSKCSDHFANNFLKEESFS